MNRENAISWIFEYINCILEECTVFSEAYTKALGEYSLLLSILRNNTPLEWSVILNKPISQKIIDQLEQKKTLFSKSLEHCQLAKFLSIALDKEFLSVDDINQSIKKLPIGEFISIEHYYLMEVIGFKPEKKFWESATLNFFSYVSNYGIDVAHQYHMTHLVFFSTNFGQCEIPIASGQKSILIDIIYKSLKLAIKDLNYDLITELCLAGLLLDSDFFKLSITKEALNLLINCQSDKGWVISDNSIRYDLSILNSKNIKKIKYSLFHTTCVILVLDTLMMKYKLCWPDKIFNKHQKALLVNIERFI